MIKEVTPGYYENIPDLIDVIKSTFGSTLDKKSTNKFKLIGLDISYNPSTRGLHIISLTLRIERDNRRLHTPRVQHAKITLNDDVARLLDFRHGAVIEKGDSMMSEFAATPSGGLHQMYILSPL